MNWKPSATVEALKLRAAFMADIRAFFSARGVLEVETPLLSQNTITDLHLDPFSTEFLFPANGKSKTYYLQTSPEFHMKRLLAAGSGAIFQLTKAFRNESQGRNHNPEFTMLEWYRPGFDDQMLMTEVDALLQQTLGTPEAIKITYQQAFLDTLAFDPLTISLAELKERVLLVSDDNWLQEEQSRDTLLQWLFSMEIEPNLGKEADVPVFVYHFPASQAALAKINPQDPRVAHRFEVYFRGLELANGYFELQDENEQKLRFSADNQQREQNGKSQHPVDEYLLAALRSGLPSCAGVALGVDRLFMLKHQIKAISQVISFDFNRA